MKKKPVLICAVLARFVNLHGRAENTPMTQISGLSYCHQMGINNYTICDIMKTFLNVFGVNGTEVE